MGPKTAWIDWLNIGLMLLAAAAAYQLPFELFLLSYSVLGPLHYLTEISWLQQRQFFARGKHDFWALVLLGGALFFISFAPLFGVKPFGMAYGAAVTYLAFMAALAMALFPSWAGKAYFLLGALLLLFAFRQQQAYLLFFAVFLPTLVHVYVFTAAFVLYGALKSKSLPGYLSFFVLLGCGAGLLLFRPEADYAVSVAAHTRYHVFFRELNAAILRLLGLPTTDAEVYASPTGLAVMRFIAFAYTYHYLNWFAKTSIIKWHLISWPRFLFIFAGWVLSVGLYAWDYRVGFIALYTLSFLHVYLEFPLNHATFLGIGRELRSRWRSETTPKPAKPTAARSA